MIGSGEPLNHSTNVRLSQEERRVFLGWHEGDEVSDSERTRDARIEGIRGKVFSFFTMSFNDSTARLRDD